MRRTIVYILSTNYAGSHFLSLLLGSNSRAKHLGEVKMLRKYSEEGPFGPDLRLTRATVLQGIGPGNIHEAYEIIFSRLSSDITTLIDASKTVRWAEEFLDDERYDKKYIHLIRDPRALVRRYALNSYFRRVWRHRWRAFKAIPQLRTRIFFAAEPYVGSYHWLIKNQMITRFLKDHQLEHTIVTYRDLAVNTAAEVQRLMEWLKLSYEPAQLEYWNFDHIGTQKRAYEWVKEKKAQFIDLRWQSEVPAEVQRNIREDRCIGEYLSSLGLMFAENGLTRKGESSASASSAATARAAHGAAKAARGT